MAQFSLFDEQYSDSTSLKHLWLNGTIVLLQVKDLEELQGWYSKLPNAHTFEEPDIGDEMTALAISGDSTLSELFKNLRLL